MLKFIMKLTPKISYISSAVVAIIFAIFFIYKGFVAYLIYKELYGGGIDALVASRWGLAFAMIIFSSLFILFIKIKDLKSHKLILNGIFIIWASLSITLMIVASEFYYFIILTISSAIISLFTTIKLSKTIEEKRHTLTEKEIYLLQQLAKKK